MFHLLSSVDVHALVEMLLQVGHHGVVPWHAVDSGVLQPRRLHHAAAPLHDQRHKLGRCSEEERRLMGKRKTGRLGRDQNPQRNRQNELSEHHSGGSTYTGGEGGGMDTASHHLLN